MGYQTTQMGSCQFAWVLIANLGAAHCACNIQTSVEVYVMHVQNQVDTARA